MQAPQSPAVEYRRSRADESALIARFQADMAHETEGKELNQAEVTVAIDYLHAHSSHGFYLVGAIQQKPEDTQTTAISSEMLTFAHDISRGTDLWWFQSVFVSKEYRGFGVFKQMFKEVEILNAERKIPLRLYVEIENTRAQQVYQRLGMFDTNEIFIEDDFYFQPNGGRIYSGHEDKYTYRLCDAAALATYQQKRAANQLRSATNRKHEDETIVAKSVDHIQKNTDFGGIFEISNTTTGEPLAYVPVFYEFSDWRNGNMIYNYDLHLVVAASSDDQQSTSDNAIVQMISGYMNYLKNSYKPALRLTNIRWIIHETQQAFKQLLITTGLEEGHYRVYEKNSF